MSATSFTNIATATYSNLTQGMNPPSPSHCNLCGSGGAAVKCDKCQSMVFCLSCDDMYHRHPKRRFHLRKAVATDSIRRSPHIEEVQMSSQPSHRLPRGPMNQQGMVGMAKKPPGHVQVQMQMHPMAGHEENVGHPSKMPIPPPRRKKKGLLSSGDSNVSWTQKINPGNLFRRFTSSEKSQQNQVQPPRLPLEMPSPDIPTQRGQQLIHAPGYPGAMFSNRDLEEWRRSSLQSSETSSDLSSEHIEPEMPFDMMPPELPQKQRWRNSLQRKNYSLHDLSGGFDPMMAQQQVFNPMYPYGPYPYPGPYDMNRWPSSSQCQSMEDLNPEDEDTRYSSEEDFSGRGTLTRGGYKEKSRPQSRAQRNATMKRSQSSQQVTPAPTPWGVPPPYYYPYPPYFPTPNFAGPPPSPPGSVRSLNMRRRRSSVDGASSTSSRYKDKKETRREEETRPHPSVSSYAGDTPRGGYYSSRSDSRPRSQTSSSHFQSDSEELDEDEEAEPEAEDEEDNFYSASGDEEPSSRQEQDPAARPWSCKYCTFVNEPHVDICEICAKSHPKKFRRSTKNKTEKEGEKRAPDEKTRRRPVRSESPVKRKEEAPEDLFDAEMIREQEEVEREVRRRLENERRIERENKKIEKKEEMLRRKSQGLGLDDMDGLKASLDEELDHERDKRDEEASNRPRSSSAKSPTPTPTRRELEIRSPSRSESGSRDSPTERRSRKNRPKRGSPEGFGRSPSPSNKAVKAVKPLESFSIDVKVNNEPRLLPPASSPSVSPVCSNGSVQNGTNNNHPNDVNYKVAINGSSAIINTGASQPPPQQPQQPLSPGSISINTDSSQSLPDPVSNGHGFQPAPQPQQQQQIPQQVTTQPMVLYSQQAVPTVNALPQYNGQQQQQQQQQNQFQQIQQPQQHQHQPQQPYNQQQAGPQILPQQQPLYPRQPMQDMRQPTFPVEAPFQSYPQPFGQSNSFIQNPDYNQQPLADNRGPGSYYGSMSRIDQALAPTGNFRDNCSSTPGLQTPGVRYMSYEDLSSATGFMNNKQIASQMASGFEMIRLLRESEKRGFSADDVEIALNFNPTNPLDWLDENWRNMTETVLTLANNQIMTEAKKKGRTKRGMIQLTLISEKEAKVALRLTKGNIWQAIEKCVKRKEEDKLFAGKGTKSFTLEINELGSGKDNMDANLWLDQEDEEEEDEDSDDPFGRERKFLYREEQEAVEMEKVDLLINSWKQERATQPTKQPIQPTEPTQPMSAKERFLTSVEDLHKIKYDNKVDTGQTEGEEEEEEEEGEEVEDEEEDEEKKEESIRRYFMEKYFGSDPSDEELDDEVFEKVIVDEDDEEEFENETDEIEFIDEFPDGEEREDGDGDEDDENKSEADNGNELEEEEEDEDEVEELSVRERLLERGFYMGDDVEEAEDTDLQVFALNDSLMIEAQKVALKEQAEMAAHPTGEPQEPPTEKRLESNASSEELRAEAQQILKEIDATFKRSLECLHSIERQNSIEKAKRQGSLESRLEEDVEKGLPEVHPPKADKVLLQESMPQTAKVSKDTANDSKDQVNSKETKNVVQQRELNDVDPKVTKQVSQTKAERLVVPKDDKSKIVPNKPAPETSDHGDTPGPDKRGPENVSAPVAAMLPLNNEQKVDSGHAEVTADKKSSTIHVTPKVTSTVKRKVLPEPKKGSPAVIKAVQSPPQPDSKTGVNNDVKSDPTAKDKFQTESEAKGRGASKSPVTGQRTRTEGDHMKAVPSTSKGEPAKSKFEPVKVKYEEPKVALKVKEEPKAIKMKEVDTEVERLKELYPNFEYARTHYDCELCAGSFGIGDMIALLSCTHRACNECLRQYFSVQIREKQKVVIPCPFCNQPELESDDEDGICNYISLLDQMIRTLMPTDLHELFQRKVRDRALHRDPTFRWCTQCSSGFIASNPCAKTIMCPDCKVVTCVKCNERWQNQHFGITCEQFAEWKEANNPEFAEEQLDRHLKDFGIDCPNCQFHYELSKGGCMHFHCIQCGFDFCGGCKKPFLMGSKCTISANCEKMGLHAHHFRNCLFYLRDKEPDELKQLLDNHDVEYKTTASEAALNARGCPIMEQKEYTEGMRDECCNRKIEVAGLCRLHYNEYLGALIMKHNIDPIEIFNQDELELVLWRQSIRLPKKCLNYRDKLVELIQEKCPVE